MTRAGRFGAGAMRAQTLRDAARTTRALCCRPEVTRHLADADAAIVWATLPAELRDAIDGALESLALPAGSYYAVPGLRDFLNLVAAMRLAADMPELGAGDALSEALELLGIEDDCDRNARPADSVLRTLRRWRESAADIDVRSPADAA